METTLIITILLLIGVFNLLTLAALGFLIIKIITPFIINNSTIKNTNETSATPVPPPTEEQLKRQKKEYEAQLEALNSLMNYNADVAYGIKKME